MTGLDPDLRLRRIAIAVRNLDVTKALFETLFGGSFSAPDRGVGGEVRCLELVRANDQPVVELVEPLSDDSALARFIRKRGEGIHHVSFETPDLDAALRRLAEAGGRVVRTPSYYRSRDGGALREAFLHPKDFHGVLFHLAEPE